jgi:hypothetical protein
MLSLHHLWDMMRGLLSVISRIVRLVVMMTAALPADILSGNSIMPGCRSFLVSDRHIPTGFLMHSTRAGACE